MNDRARTKRMVEKNDRSSLSIGRKRPINLYRLSDPES